MNSVLKKTLAVTALSLGLAGVAQAGAVAFGSLIVQDTIIWQGSTADFNDINVVGTQYDVSDFPIIVAGNNSTAGAGLNGVNISDSSGGPSPGDQDVAMQCLGANCGLIAQNDFTEQLPLGALGNFSRGDSQLVGAIITGVNPVSSATAEQVAEGQLVSTAFGDATGEVTNGTAFSFSLATADQVVFDFSAQSIIDTLLNPDAEVPPSFAQAATSFSITITQEGVGAPIFEWRPDGNGTISAGGTSVQDLASLQNSRATLLPGTSNSVDTGLNFYRAVTPLLAAGVNYTLNIQGNANMDIRKEVVPEPGVLALMGISIFGLGFFRRRDKKA